MQGEEGPQGPPGEIGVKGDKVGEFPGVLNSIFKTAIQTKQKRLKNPQILNWDSDSDENCKFTYNIYSSAGRQRYPGPTGSSWQKGRECE